MNTSRALLLGALLASPAIAQLPDVAIVAAASTNPTDCRFLDVQSYLTNTGQFGNVDVIDATSVTPTLGTLSAYDGVITWTNFDYADPVALGDVFADYVDQGGAVVVAVFANTTTGANRYLQGRRLTGYELIESALGNTSNSATLGTIHDPSHPIVAGVTSLSANNAFRPFVTAPILQGAVIAEWSDGAPLIVADAPLTSRVDIGLYPPSDNCSGGFWNQGTSGDVIVANALLYAISGGTGGALGTNYCTASQHSTGSAAPALSAPRTSLRGPIAWSPTPPLLAPGRPRLPGRRTRPSRCPR